MEDKKPFYKSKVIWFNLLAAGMGFLQDNPILPPKYLGPVLVVGNIFLRFVTVAGLK